MSKDFKPLPQEYFSTAVSPEHIDEASELLLELESRDTAIAKYEKIKKLKSTVANRALTKLGAKIRRADEIGVWSQTYNSSQDWKSVNLSDIGINEVSGSEAINEIFFVFPRVSYYLQLLFMMNNYKHMCILGNNTGNGWILGVFKDVEKCQSIVMGNLDNFIIYADEDHVYWTHGKEQRSMSKKLCMLYYRSICVEALKEELIGIAQSNLSDQTEQAWGQYYRVMFEGYNPLNGPGDTYLDILLPKEGRVITKKKTFIIGDYRGFNPLSARVSGFSVTFEGAADINVHSLIKSLLVSNTGQIKMAADGSIADFLRAGILFENYFKPQHSFECGFQKSALDPNIGFAGTWDEAVKAGWFCTLNNCVMEVTL